MLVGISLWFLFKFFIKCHYFILSVGSLPFERRLSQWRFRTDQNNVDNITCFIVCVCVCVCFVLFWATPRGMRNFPDQGLNPHPLQGKRVVLTAGPPGKSSCVSNGTGFLFFSLASFYLLHAILYHSPCSWGPRRGKVIGFLQWKKDFGCRGSLFYFFPEEIHFAFTFLMARAVCLLIRCSM